MSIFRPFVEFARRTLGVAKRSIDSLPWLSGGPLHPSQVSNRRALSLIPYFACVRVLAEQVSSLPLQAFRKDGDVRKRITDPQLLQHPAAIGTNVRWLRQVVISLASRGNAYGLIISRDGFQFPTMIEWLCPDDVHVDETMPTMPKYYFRGQFVPRENIVHIAWFVEPGRVKGLSPVAAFAASIGVGLQTTDYGLSWFENGGTPPATFKNTAKMLEPREAEIISDRLLSFIRRRRPIVHGKDWEFTGLKVTPEESQFIETMKINATQMAAIFGVPAEMVGGETGGSLTYNTPALNGDALLKMVLRPWLILIESEITALLPDRQYVLFNADAVVRADLKTRYEAYQIALTPGTAFMTPNEVRALEDLEPVAGGDTLPSLPKPAAPTAPPAVPAAPPVEPQRLNGRKIKELEHV